MTDETIVAPDAATQNPAPEVTTDETVETNEAPVETPETKPELSAAEKEAKALRRRVDRLTQQKYQMAAELETARHRPEQPQDDDGQLTARIQSEARKLAAEMTKKQSLEQRSASIEAELKKAVGDGLPDFYDELQSAGPAATVFLQTAFELDDAAKVLAHFAGDRDELDRVLQMSPVKQAAFMGRLSARLETEKSAPKTSSAPKPLSPVKSSATAGMPDPSDTERYIAWRREQRSKQR